MIRMRTLQLLCVLVVYISTAYCQDGPVSVFTYGVACGEVTSTSVNLWTRAQDSTSVTAQVSTTASFSETVFTTSAVPLSDDDFTVEVAVNNLQPHQAYYYRFVDEGSNAVSDVGSFVTSPGSSQSEHVKFAWTGDSDGTLLPDGTPYWNNFEVLEQAAGEGLDFFVYEGDTVYSDGLARQETYPEEAIADTLDEYWSLYKLNRNYTALRQLLQSTSVYAMWDDHEVYNDWNSNPNIQIAQMGRKAFEDYWMTPTTPQFSENITNLQDDTCVFPPFFRHYRWSKDIDLIILDERSCRTSSDAVNRECTISGDVMYPYPLAPDTVRDRLMPGILKIFTEFGSEIDEFVDIGDHNVQASDSCVAALNDPGRSILGKRQKEELKKILLESDAKFKLIVNEVPIQQLLLYPYDRWEGFPVERNEILTFIRDNNITNVVFLTTDIHMNIMNEVYVDVFANDRSALSVAHEFVVGPIAEASPEALLHSYLRGKIGDTAGGILFDLVKEEIREYGREVLHSANAPLCYSFSRDLFAYGVAEFDPSSGQLTVSIKDQQGRVIGDSDGDGVADGDGEPGVEGRCVMVLPAAPVELGPVPDTGAVTATVMMGAILVLVAIALLLS